MKSAVVVEHRIVVSTSQSTSIVGCTRPSQARAGAVALIEEARVVNTSNGVLQLVGAAPEAADVPTIEHVSDARAALEVPCSPKAPLRRNLQQPGRASLRMQSVTRVNNWNA